MTVVHIVEPFASGIAVFVRSLTETMPADTHIVIHGERKNIMRASEVRKIFPTDNVRFIRWRYAQRSINPFKDFLALVELSVILQRLKRTKQVDAVHLHSSKSGLLGRLACRLVRISNVFYTPNGASFLSANNRIARYFYRQLEKIGNRLCGRVICCSVSELSEYLKLGINAEYINNGIDVSVRLQAAISRGSDFFTVVTSGRIERQKNPQLFNEIASYFSDMKQIRFLWIGDGEDKVSFTSRNISVTGWLHHQEVSEHIQGADMYLSTAMYEGLSFAALEAMALKKPVLLSNCTGNSDIVKRGINGDLFTTPTEAIMKIVQYFNNREMLEVMGGFSEQICKTEFDVKQNFRGYRDLYAGAQADTPDPVKWSYEYEI